MICKNGKGINLLVRNNNENFHIKKRAVVAAETIKMYQILVTGEWRL